MPSISSDIIEISSKPELSSSAAQSTKPSASAINHTSTFLTTAPAATSTATAKTTQIPKYQYNSRISDTISKEYFRSNDQQQPQQQSKYNQTSSTSSPRLHSPYLSQSTNFPYDDLPSKSSLISCSPNAQYISQIQSSHQPNENLSNTRFSPVNPDSDGIHKKILNTSYDAGRLSLSSSPTTIHSRQNSPQPVYYITSNTLNRTNSTKSNDSASRSYLTTQQNQSYLYQQQLHQLQSQQANQLDSLDGQFNSMNIAPNVTDILSDMPMNQLYNASVSINARNPSDVINGSNANEYSNLAFKRDIIYNKIGEFE